jgi:hypothetical protein
MVIALHEVANFSLVILNLDLLTTDDAVRQFQAEADVDIRREVGVNIDPVSGQAGPVKTFHLDRDRITMNLSEARSTITKEFPVVNSLESEVSRFADVVSHALSSRNNLNTAKFDFGYNAEMVFAQDASPTAFRFLGDHLINYGKIAVPNHQFLGGACQMIILDDHQRQWTYNLAPRFNDTATTRVFMGINLQSSQRRLPRGAEVTSALNQIVHDATGLMERLSE